MEAEVKEKKHSAAMLQSRLFYPFLELTAMQIVGPQTE